MSPPTGNLSPLSALTVLSDDEDQAQDGAALVPSKDAAHEAYGKATTLVLDVIGDLEKQIAGVRLAPERREELRDSMMLLRRRASQKPYKVAIGSVSSNNLTPHLSHALNLERQVNPPQCSSTIFAATYLWKGVYGPEITAKISYKSFAQWKTELSHLIADVLEANVDPEESADTSHLSPAYQAKEKLYQIYPHLRDTDVTMWDADSLLADSTVSDCLGKEPSISDSDHEEFRKKLEQCMSSGGSRSVWPLVESVHIRGAFPVLSTGITLVDLPGHGDVDNMRNNSATEYMRDADAVFLVTSIARAIDDRDTHKYLEQHLSQIFVDGRIGEKSIALILTGADIPFDETGVEPVLASEIDKLTAQIEILKHRIATGRSNKVGEWKEKITTKRQDREQRILLRNSLLAQHRSHSVASVLQEKHRQIYSTLSQLPDGQAIPHIPIFCVGSCDYLCLSRLLPATPLVFSSKEDTSIPSLHEYIQLNGELHSLQDGVNTLSMSYQLLTRVSHVPCRDSDVEQDIISLEKRCTVSADALVESIEVIFKRIAGEVAKAVSVAEERSSNVFQNIAMTLRWNQYLALMRREGEYGVTNLNADLTATILPSVQNQWHVGINVEIATLLSVFFEVIENDLNTTVQALVVRSSSKIDTVRKSLGVESYMRELFQAVQQSIARRQREGSRIWAPSIKAQLAPQYAKVASEKGRGMFKRMKELNEAFIRDSAHMHEIFESLNHATRTGFKESVDQVRPELLGGLKRIVREIQLLFVGFGTAVSDDLEGLALVESMMGDKMDRIFDVMDALKLRCQEIQLHLSP
ncbi:hypothetical protein B0H13DRAFT_2661314 [Mycena leptocephala]|nr:hypothetical protein B0H13DRAFT_2661314 [Mycena leptocephala]